MTFGSTNDIPSVGRVLAVDWGEARIGLAISDETQLIATPLTTLTRRVGKRLPMHEFLTVVESHLPVGLVVGLPFNDDGEEGETAGLARAMGEAFAAKAGLPLAWVDESFSTTETLERLTARGIAPRRRKEMIDAMAAAVVLERWLATRIPL